MPIADILFYFCKSSVKYLGKCSGVYTFVQKIVDSFPSSFDSCYHNVERLHLHSFWLAAFWLVCNWHVIMSWHPELFHLAKHSHVSYRGMMGSDIVHNNIKNGCLLLALSLKFLKQFLCFSIAGPEDEWCHMCNHIKKEKFFLQNTGNCTCSSLFC